MHLSQIIMFNFSPQTLNIIVCQTQNLAYYLLKMRSF
jgi:hypothetical protein